MSQRAINPDAVAFALMQLGRTGGPIQAVMAKLLPGATDIDRKLFARLHGDLQFLREQGTAAKHDTRWALTEMARLQITMAGLAMQAATQQQKEVTPCQSTK